MKFTGEEWGKTSFVDPYPANLVMVASWAKDGAAKYKLLQNILAVHVIKKADGYRDKKKEIYKRQKEFLERKNGGQKPPSVKELRKNLL